MLAIAGNMKQNSFSSNLKLILLNKLSNGTKELNQQAKQQPLQSEKLTQNHDYSQHHLFRDQVQACIIFKL